LKLPLYFTSVFFWLPFKEGKIAGSFCRPKIGKMRLKMVEEPFSRVYVGKGKSLKKNMFMGSNYGFNLRNVFGMGVFIFP